MLFLMNNILTIDGFACPRGRCLFPASAQPFSRLVLGPRPIDESNIRSMTEALDRPIIHK